MNSQPTIANKRRETRAHYDRYPPLPVAASWRFFHDQFTTPQCTCHTFAELAGWAPTAGLVCEEQRKEAANQLATLRFTRPEPS